ncbi:hypothetical protein HPB48_000785 [Haemaphysalis longicornis]|uniref:C2H2-type domain-containing protein n=1 Tax=Haemaphysalis longicornis TaxID=44386 RepID=A0A9J6GJ71_HAELO|nr:hypothetical protein HPB48_000785 [Haemaphysalis longicornis]
MLVRRSTDQKIHFLGVASLPQKVEETLKLGPKFATHPNLDKLELLSLVRAAASKASAEDEERCIHEGVDVLPPSGIRSSRTRNVVRELRATNTKLLLSDEEGGFAVASESEYKARADLAISENFREIVRAKPDRKKKEAIEMCERRRKELLGHIRAQHWDEKSHACQICEAAFKLRSQLTVHLKLYAGCLLHKCPVCGKGLRVRWRLTDHVRERHVSENKEKGARRI